MFHISGKTAPRLLHDIQLYDPRKPPPSGFNILTDIPVHDDEQTPPPPLVGKGSCKHQWALKRNQCRFADLRINPHQQREYVVAAYCAVCRSHLELKISSRNGDPLTGHCCPDSRPLHHFTYDHHASKPRWVEGTPSQRDSGFTWSDIQCFHCSSWECSAEVTISFRPPRLIGDWVDLLNKKTIIKARAGRIIAADPARFEGFAVPPPVDILLHSKHYITNPLFNPEKSKKIQGHNKRFLLSMGEPCAPILEYFGFVREVCLPLHVHAKSLTQSCQNEDWVPPVVEPATMTPFTNELNIRIDDVEKELFVLISKASEEDKRKAAHEWAPEPAISELESLLGCTNCKYCLIRIFSAHCVCVPIDQKDTRTQTVDLARNTPAHP